MDALCYPQEARLAHPSWDDQLVVKVLPSPRKLEYVLIASYRLIASCSASRIGWVSLRLDVYVLREVLDREAGSTCVRRGQCCAPERRGPSGLGCGEIDRRRP